MPTRTPRLRSRRPAFESQVADEVLRVFPEWPDAVAQALGDAPQTKRLTSAEELDMYAFEDQRYPDARALVQMGYSQEEATMMRFPLRMKSIRSGRPSAKEQVRAAKDLRKRYLAAIADGWEPPRGVLKSSVGQQAAQGAPDVAEAEAAMMQQQQAQMMGAAPGMAPPPMPQAAPMPPPTGV